MAIRLIPVLGRGRTIAATTSIFLIAVLAAPLSAQEVKDNDGKKENDSSAEADSSDADAKAKDPKGEGAAEKEAEETDRFAVPEDASAKELFDFIQSVKRNRGNTIESVMKAARKPSRPRVGIL